MPRCCFSVLTHPCAVLWRVDVQAREEMEDLSQEFDRERDTMLETIREQNREIKLWEQVRRPPFGIDSQFM